MGKSGKKENFQWIESTELNKLNKLQKIKTPLLFERPEKALNIWKYWSNLKIIKKLEIKNYWNKQEKMMKAEWNCNTMKTQQLENWI